MENFANEDKVQPSSEEVGLESFNLVLEQLKSELEKLTKNNNRVSEDEKRKVMENITNLESSLKRLGDKARQEDKMQEIRQNMEKDLGSDYESKIKTFLKSLGTTESLLVQSFLHRSGPRIDHAFGGLDTFSIEGIFTEIISKDRETLIKQYENWAHEITRGLGKKVRDQETGEMIEITQENWRKGPRGQWYATFEDGFHSLLDKVDQLKQS
jgi:ERCC4-related helicase